MSSCDKCKEFEESHFCSLDKGALSLLNKSKSRIEYKKNEVVFSEGELPKGLYCVGSGVIKVCRIDEEGREIISRIHKAGDILGYRALFANQPYQATAISHEASAVCFIPKDVISSLLSSPGLAVRFLTQLSTELSRAEDRMAAIASMPVLPRIAQALIFFKSELPHSKWTRRDIAEWVGTTPETVIRSLSLLEQQGLIKQVGRSIDICEPQKLFEVANPQANMM